MLQRIKVITTCVALFCFHELLSFQGRIGRLQFFAIELLAFLPMALATIVMSWMALPEPVEFVVYVFCFFYWVAATLGAAARRLHDIGRGGGYCVLLTLIWPVLISVPGQAQENSYGLPPENSPVWWLALAVWPALFGAFWVSDYLNPADKVLVMHNLSGEEIYTYHVGEAWDGVSRTRCCVRINGVELNVTWSIARTSEQIRRGIPREHHELQVTNPARQPNEQHLHVYFLPENQVHLAWSGDFTSPVSFWREVWAQSAASTGCLIGVVSRLDVSLAFGGGEGQIMALSPSAPAIVSASSPGS